MHRDEFARQYKALLRREAVGFRCFESLVPRAKLQEHHSHPPKHEYWCGAHISACLFWGPVRTLP